MQLDSSTPFDRATPNVDLLTTELQAAHLLLPKYASAIVVKASDDSDDAHRRAMLQTVFRLQLLRVEVAKLMAKFVGLSADASVVESEEYFLRWAVTQIAENTFDPISTRRDLCQMFGLTDKVT